jgi:hypothetical protein
MNKNTYYELFNNKCFEFINDLLTSFPEFKDQFLSIKTGLNLISNLDVKSPCNIYKNHVLSKYGNAIDNTDETIFLKEDKFYDYENKNDEEYWGSFINNIKTIWVGLNNENKEAIWKYFKLLNTLSRLTIQK